MKETPHISNLYKNQQVLMNQVYLDGTRKRKRCDVSTGVMNFRERKEISKFLSNKFKLHHDFDYTFTFSNKS